MMNKLPTFMRIYNRIGLFQSTSEKGFSKKKKNENRPF